MGQLKFAAATLLVGLVLAGVVAVGFLVIDGGRFLHNLVATLLINGLAFVVVVVAVFLMHGSEPKPADPNGSAEAPVVLGRCDKNELTLHAGQVAACNLTLVRPEGSEDVIAGCLEFRHPSWVQIRCQEKKRRVSRVSDTRSMMPAGKLTKGEQRTFEFTVSLIETEVVQKGWLTVAYSQDDPHVALIPLCDIELMAE